MDRHAQKCKYTFYGLPGGSRGTIICVHVCLSVVLGPAQSQERSSLDFQTWVLATNTKKCSVPTYGFSPLRIYVCTKMVFTVFYNVNIAQIQKYENLGSVPTCGFGVRRRVTIICCIFVFLYFCISGFLDFVLGPLNSRGRLSCSCTPIWDMPAIG